MARQASLVLRLLNLPSFLLAVFIMYWSVPLCILQNRIRPWKLRGPRNDAYGWGLGLQRLFGIRLRQVPGPTLYKGGPCIWLCNHRSWADFFVDVVTTQGDSQMLSRMAVAAVFPMFMASVVIIRSVILFRRGTIRDKEVFNAMIEKMMAASPVNGLNVYPEGHRSTKPQSLPLRRGMMHYAYSRHVPVQIVITSNKEAVISEKDMSAHFGQTLIVGYSDVIDPKDFSTADAFLDAISKSWHEEWQRVYSTDRADTVPFKDSGVDYHVVYTPSIKFWSVFSQGGSLLCLLATVYGTLRGVLWLAARLGPARTPVTTLLAAWFAASAWLATRDVRPPLLPRETLQNGSLQAVAPSSSADNLASTATGVS